MAPDALGTRWLVLYGPHIFPPRLRPILGSVKPLSSSTVLVRDAWLVWDIVGVPFIEPCFTNAVVRGYNDDGHGGKDGEGYKRWVWERASPGLPYEGAFPPSLEGIAFELTTLDFDTILARTVAASSFPSSTPTALVPVTATTFENGDPDKPLRDVSAYVLIGKTDGQSVKLQPTQKYQATVLRGAFFSVLSRPYIAHLMHISPFVAASPSKRITRALFRLLLLPSFLIFHLPSKLLGIPLWGKLGKAIGAGPERLRRMERVLKRFVGSGYHNEDEHAAGMATKH